MPIRSSLLLSGAGHGLLLAAAVLVRVALCAYARSFVRAEPQLVHEIRFLHDPVCLVVVLPKGAGYANKYTKDRTQLARSVLQRWDYEKISGIGNFLAKDLISSLAFDFI